MFFFHENMKLMNNIFFYFQYYPDTSAKGKREGSGSTEATEMILNNLFYITAKVITFSNHLDVVSRCALVTYPSFDIHAEKDVLLFNSTVNLHYVEVKNIQFQTVNLNPDGKKSSWLI